MRPPSTSGCAAAPRSGNARASQRRVRELCHVVHARGIGHVELAHRLVQGPERSVVGGRAVPHAARRIGVEVAADEPHLLGAPAKLGHRVRHTRLDVARRLGQLAHRREVVGVEVADPPDQVVAVLGPEPRRVGVADVVAHPRRSRRDAAAARRASARLRIPERCWCPTPARDRDRASIGRWSSCSRRVSPRRAVCTRQRFARRGRSASDAVARVRRRSPDRCCAGWLRWRRTAAGSCRPSTFWGGLCPRASPKESSKPNRSPMHGLCKRPSIPRCSSWSISIRSIASK